MTLVDHFRTVAEAAPERTAIIEGGGRSITYAALDALSAKLAGRFREKGVTRGDHVLVATWPSIELYAGLSALWRLGAVAVFPETAMGLAGVRHAALSSKPKALLAPFWVRCLAKLFPETRAIPLGLSPTDSASSPVLASEAQEHDFALISFTSGTTGKPKVIARSHALLMAQHKALRSLIESQRNDIDLVAFPAFVLTCLGYGTTAILPAWNMRRPDLVEPGDIHNLIGAHGITRLLIPPTITERLAQNRLPATVQRVFTGGGPVYPDIIRRFLESSPGVGLTVVYGSTEAEPISHIETELLTAADWQTAADGGGLPVGHPVPEVRVMMRDEEIIVTGDHVNKSYVDTARNAETKITAHGEIWHCTGDRGRLDAQGRLWLLGRAMGPVGIHPFAVECAARSWPGVADAACVVDETGAVSLFVAGDQVHSPEWQLAAARIGVSRVIPLMIIPKDKRHRSKPDYTALKQSLQA